jgi:hypothetical protein
MLINIAINTIFNLEIAREKRKDNGNHLYAFQKMCLL